MSIVSDDLASVHGSTMDLFGQDVLYRPAGGDEVAKRGLVQTGAQIEKEVPGINTQVTFKASDFDTAPAKGDEVTLEDSDSVIGGVYKVYRVRSVDGGTGEKAARIHRLLVRRDRAVGAGS